MINFFYTIYAWTAGIICTAFFGSLAIFLSLFDSSGSMAHLCGRLWGRTILCCIGIRVSLEGKENLIREGGQILLSNHQGILDILVYEGYLPLQFRWIARKNLFDIPILGWSMRRAGYIPIVREGKKNMLKSIITAANKIKQGSKVLVFPEGTRSSDGKLGQFKKGTLLIVMKSLAPIIPIVIDGSYALLPKGTLRIKPGKIKVRILTPFYPDKLEESEQKNLLDRCHNLILNELGETECAGKNPEMDNA